MNMHNNKRRQNGMNGNGGQNRYNNNRPRKYGAGRGNGDDSANVTRIRRHAMQSREKYNNMARDALASGDRVLAENYLQHADHFYRVLLSLPQEEVRPAYPQGAFTGEEIADKPLLDGQQAPAAFTGGEESRRAASSAAAPALPSFITQPMPQENLQD